MSTHSPVYLVSLVNVQKNCLKNYNEGVVINNNQAMTRAYYGFLSHFHKTLPYKRIAKSKLHFYLGNPILD